MKNLRGFFLAPLPAALLAAILGVTIGYAQATHRLVALFIFICLLLYATELVFGIAISIFLKRRQMTTLGFYALGGVAMTSIPNAPYTAWSISIGHPVSAGLAYFPLIALYGAVTGATFWVVIRPDKS